MNLSSCLVLLSVLIIIMMSGAKANTELDSIQNINFNTTSVFENYQGDEQLEFEQNRFRRHVELESSRNHITPDVGHLTSKERAERHDFMSRVFHKLMDKMIQEQEQSSGHSTLEDNSNTSEDDTINDVNSAALDKNDSNSLLVDSEQIDSDQDSNPHSNNLQNNTLQNSKARLLNNSENTIKNNTDLSATDDVQNNEINDHDSLPKDNEDQDDNDSLDYEYSDENDYSDES